jgi:GT2 family glycosyltransferase
MPRWRTERGAPRPDAREPAAFQPVRIVRVDVDSGTVEGGELGDHEGTMWVEATLGGQVVGRIEARIDGDRPPEAVLAEVASVFRDASAGPPSEAVPDEQLPDVTVVVPTLAERPSELARVLGSLEGLDYPRYDVIVVDNRRDDLGPPLVFPDHPNVRVVTQRVPGVSAARNRGFDDSTGAIVAFTDDDVIVEPRWLRALASRFALEPGLDALGGLVLPSQLETQAQLWFEEYYGGFSQSFRRSTVTLATEHDPLVPYAPGRFGSGCNMAFRRDALASLGGFDEMLGTGTPAKGGEDLAIYVELVRRGGTTGFEPAAVVRHAHRRSQKEFLHQVRLYGTGLMAMYTALVVEEPRTLVELARRAPAGLRLLVRPRGSRSPSTRPTYPRRALLYQIAGMVLGPFAYARSRASAARTGRGKRP